jgi:hypothetical protein
MSFGVKVSGIFIIDAVEGAGTAGEGARSGVLQALPPHGSLPADIMLAAAAVAALGAGTLGAGGWIGGAEILNADFISCWGEVAVDLGGETIDADAVGGEESPNKSFERDEDGGFGLAVGEVNPPNPKSCPFEDMEVVRDWGLGADMVGEAKLSKKSPLMGCEGDVTLGAAGVDLAPPKDARLENAEGLSTGLAGGGDVVVGKLSPLKASVRPPIFDEAEGGAGEAISPNELPRWCCTGGAGCGFEYKDKIDCLRSGRDIPAGAAGVDDVLFGRLAAEG